jgi:uncharacterized membrane protein YccF (DUF307 family)
MSKKISPVWLVMSVILAFAVSRVGDLKSQWVVVGLALVAFGGYLIGRAEEYYQNHEAHKTIYDKIKNPMYIGTSLLLAGVATGMQSLVIAIVACIWSIGAVFLSLRENHSSNS